MLCPMSETHLSETRFKDFNLPESIQQGIDDCGFVQCTPIQEATIPIALKGHDVAGQAQTGTGKTAAFLIVTLNQLMKYPADKKRRDNQPRCLILAPTRELAIQIHKDAVALSAHTDMKLGLVYGGVDYEKQRQQLKQDIDILIGTPGRLIDYHKQGVFDLRAVQVLVLDEADRMFDLGFIKDLRFLLRRMTPPAKRLNMLFSATLSYRVMELAYEHMNSPEKVEIQTEQVTADRVRQAVYYPSNDEKISLLIGLIQKHEPERSIVFVNTKHAAETIYRWLNGNAIATEMLSGDVPQKKRQRLLQEFSEGKYRALVATDVAARGLHIPDVSHVFNFDLPQSAEDYVHRIGRTARAGAEGDAISFACEDTSFYLPEIEEYVGRSIPMESVTSELLVKPEPPIKKEYRPRPHQKSAGGRRNQSDNRPRNKHRHRKKQHS